MYEKFETSPDLEFDHYLCERLGWRSVALMRRHMSAAEWHDWSIYYGRKAQSQQLAIDRAKG